MNRREGDIDMTHKAKRIGAGEYQYRGHSISRQWTEFGGGSWEWFISDNQTWSSDCSDPQPTLRDAKSVIDASLA
jgi:hypothetical protein